MANSLKFIKTVHSVNEVNNLQTLFEFVLGEDLPQNYDPSRKYNPLELVVKFDNKLNKNVIFLCVEKTNGGAFVEASWKRISIKDLLSRDHLSLGSSKDLTMISEEMPSAKNNRVWMKPMVYKDLDTDKLENGNMFVIFNGSEFVGQDDQPDDDNIKLWFDYEFDYEVGTDI